MGWEDLHLHRFVRHGKEYGIAKPGGAWFDDNPTQILLSDLRLRLKERFLYEYDFIALWQHEPEDRRGAVCCLILPNCAGTIAPGFEWPPLRAVGSI